MPTDVAYHKARRNRLKAKRANFDALYQEIDEYTEPHSSTHTLGMPSHGARQTDRMFDSTAPHAKELLASAIHDAAMSPAMPWFKLKLRRKELNDLQPVREWLEEVEARMYMALQQSNFHKEIHQSIRDYVKGTACIYVDERSKRDYRGPSTFAGLRYLTIPFAHYVVDESDEGMVDTIYVDHRMTVRTIVQRWGEEAAGKTVTDRLKSHPDEEMLVVHCVGPRNEYDPKKL